jgi:basic membrane protein A
VGLVTDFGPTTSGIYQEAWLALQDAKAAGIVDRVDRIETVDPRDRAVNVATFGVQGYDIIVTVGPSISDETIAAALKYPTLLFIGVEQPQATKVANLTGLVFHEERSGFLAGGLAALVTQTQHIAAVCEARFVDPVRRYCDGFQAGAKYAKPEVHVTVAYREGPREKLFQDPAWGNSEAVGQVHQGVDVLFAAGGETADGALQAAAAQGAFVIGTETDLYLRLVEVRPRLLTSATNDVRRGVLGLLRLARQGQLPSGEYMGQVGLAPFHALDGSIPANIRSQMLRLGDGLDTGAIDPDVPYKSP